MRTLPSRLQPAAVIPGEHVLGFVGLQEVVASELTKDPLSDRVLEAFQELGGEGGGFVKAEAVGWGFGVPVWIDPLEDAVHHAKVEVVVRIEGRAEAMEEADGCKRRGIRCGRTGLPQDGLKGPEEDMEDSAGGPGPAVEEGPQALGDREHDLAHRDVGEDMVHQVDCGLGHALGVAGGAGPSPLARKRPPGSRIRSLSTEPWQTRGPRFRSASSSGTLSRRGWARRRP